MQNVPYFLLITGAVMIGLWFSNYFYDHGIKHWLARKVGHFFGGVGFLLMPFLFPDNWILAVVLVGGFAVLLTGARVLKPHTFRGVGGDARPGALAELYFPWTAIPVLAVGWGLWGRPLESVACLLFMSWGDGLTGWVRALRYTTPTKGIFGSFAMFATCLVIAWAFMQPLWLGALAAAGATLVEWASGDASEIRWMRWSDDNWTIPVTAFTIYFGGLAALGRL